VCSTKIYKITIENLFFSEGFFFLYLRLLISTRALPSRYTTGYLQRCLQWVVTEMFAVYPILLFFLKSTGQYLDGTLGVLPDLISLCIFLKCLEDTSEEACDADGVYVVLHNQRWGERFENRWAVF